MVVLYVGGHRRGVVKHPRIPVTLGYDGVTIRTRIPRGGDVWTGTEETTGHLHVNGRRRGGCWGRWTPVGG